MPTCLIDSVKRDNGKIIGLAIFQENTPFGRIYEEISHGYYRQVRGKSYQYFIEHIPDEKTMLKKRFQIVIDKNADDYFIVMPEDVLQKKAIQNLPEYFFKSGDAT